MATTIEVRYIDTESGDMLFGELVNPFRLDKEGNGIVIDFFDETNEAIVVMALRGEGEWVSTQVGIHNVNAIRAV